jgi:peptidylprolyl isomerase
MIDNGKNVKVHYKGTLEDGTIFDSSEGREPIEFAIGGGTVIPGFEEAIKEMAVEESKTITIPSAEAYGEYQDNMVGEFPRDQLPGEFTPEVGMVLEMQTPDGDMPVRITELGDETLMLDANHPLAGQDLTFELTLVAVG